AVRQLVDEFESVTVVYPMHKNPKVIEIAEQYLVKHDIVENIEPLDVLDLHIFASISHLILTDSGDVQEEAPSLGMPVLVLRDTTERPEGVKAGTLKLAGIEQENIYQLAKELLTDDEKYQAMAQTNNPYGDGQASKRICENIKYYYGIRKEKPISFSVND